MQIVNSEKNLSGKLLITIEIDIESGGDMLSQEDSLATLLNEVGLVASQDLLLRHNTFSQTLKVGETLYYHKGVQKKSTKRHMGL